MEMYYRRSRTVRIFVPAERKRGAPAQVGPEAFHHPDIESLPGHLQSQMMAVAAPYKVRSNANGNAVIGNS